MGVWTSDTEAVCQNKISMAPCCVWFTEQNNQSSSDEESLFCSCKMFLFSSRFLNYFKNCVKQLHNSGSAALTHVCVQMCRWRKCWPPCVWARVVSTDWLRPNATQWQTGHISFPSLSIPPSFTSSSLWRIVCILVEARISVCSLLLVMSVIYLSSKNGSDHPDILTDWVFFINQ